jgi:broad specificity phosphatase PhoE
VVTHAGVISQLVGYLTDTSPAQWERYRTDNAALTELKWERGHRRVVRFNDRHYLQPAGQEPRNSAEHSSAPESVRPAKHPDPFSR